MDSQFDFSEGTNCLIGSIGSGKTSVYDAICFALFGTFPQLQQKKMRLADVIMKKPKQQQKAEVSVKFEIENDEYSVKRTVEKGKSSAELRKNSALVEAQPQRVTEEIEKVLKMDYDLFTRAVYSEQNALDMFLIIPKGQRMKKIDELLRLDKFETARASCVSLVNRFEISKSEKEQLLKTMQQDESIRNIEKIKEELKSIENEKTGLENELEKIRRQKSDKKSELERLQNIEKKIQAISEEINALSALNKQLESDLEEISQALRKKEISERYMKNISEDIEEISKTIESEAENLDSLRQEFADASAAKRTLEQELSEWEEEIKERKEIEKRLLKKEKISALLEEKRREVEGERSFLQMLEIKIFNLGKDIKEIESADRCPVCYQDLPEEKKKKLIAQKQKEISKLEKQKEKHGKSTGMLEDKLHKLENEMDELKEDEIRLKGLRTLEDVKKIKLELEEALRKISLSEREIKMLDKNILLLRQSLEKKNNERNELRELLARRSELERKSKIITANQNKIEVLKKEKTILEKQFSKEKLAELSELLYSLIGSESGTEQKIENADLIIKEKQKRLEEIESKLETMKGYQSEVAKASVLANQMALLEKGLLLTQEQLRKNFVIAINQVMHNVWRELYPYGDFFSVRLGIEGDYVLQLQDSTGWISAEAVSGGERSLACLTLRIAFALVLAPQLRWLVLDEPTHNLDAKAIDELARTLHDRITEFVDQVFLITHDPALEAAVSGFLYRLERDKENNGFTKVIRLGE